METELPKDLGDIFSTLLALKQQGDALDHAQLKQLSDAGALKILEFRAEHRQFCENTEALREATSNVKQTLDQSTLQLQNLLYEKQHYEKEINGCRTFRSAFTDELLELLPLEEFANLPDAQAEGLAIADDPHQLMMNRLQHELTFRQQTVQELEALKSKRDALAAEVAQQRSAIGGIEGEISKLREGALKVQQQFNIAPTGLQTQLSDTSKLAMLLPSPLYILYCSLSAAAAAGGLPVALAVEGNAAKAEKLHQNYTLLEINTNGQNMFPLTVTATVASSIEAGPSAEPTLTATFAYITSLGAVAVAGATSKQDAILASLYDGDTGTVLPPTAHGNTNVPSDGSVDVSKMPGKPYMWAQHAAGLDRLPPQQVQQGVAQVQEVLRQHVQERAPHVLLKKLVAAAAAGVGGATS